MNRCFCHDGHFRFGLCYVVLAVQMLITYFRPLPIIVQMLTSTVSIIYIGSFLSLSQTVINPITGEKCKSTESLTRKDAMLSPVIGSVALFSLYLAYRFLPTYWVNLLLTSYLFIIGTFTLMETLMQFVSIVFFKCDNITKETKFVLCDSHFKLGGYIENPNDPRGYEVKITIHHIWSLVISLILGIVWVLTDSWIIHNMFAISFSIQAISLISLGNFKIGAILLCGLFVYDIFWVFGTDVMVTVAKSFHGPAKLIFPVSLNPWKQSILGLGDIVIPGLFISLCLRFDLREFSRTQKNVYSMIKNSQNTATFFTVLISYSLGLITTACVMLYFKAAQPALLYLVPFCLLALFGSVLYRNEYIDAWNYSEEDSSVTSDSDSKVNQSGSEVELTGDNSNDSPKTELKQRKKK
ncbi:Minor histocompatibility antigen H13-like presenilin peptidase family [Cryptosporidium bovis]|uniref:Minor histocompatibility antigen H13-like presenilin peptidase family n=1 Tax=Cryptosporidium bovis TaxID=310047 RepID=UPI00351A7316|nr:Minor histocompatibility antigen H13-like presenilin peptidase family [Cryptosporidium bovis]